MTRIIVCLLLLCSSQLMTAQSVVGDYKSRLLSIQQTIRLFFYDSATQYYKEHYQPDTGKQQYSYLWPLCALVQAANETEKVQANTISMKDVLKNINDYFDATGPVPAFGSHIIKLKREDRFYDDNQWIGIACMDAWERTGQSHFLTQGKDTYRYMMTGFDTVSGGGLYWKEGDYTTKNTCSNGPGIILALQLYKATRQKKYLDTAVLLYRWTNRHLRSPKGVYYDNIVLPSRKIDTRTYTYNTGTMLQSNVLLYEITREANYLQEARRLAEGAFIHFFNNKRWPPNAWFNAVLLRGYMALYTIDKDRKYIDAFITDGNERWMMEKDNNQLLGRGKRKQLIEQAAMLEIYARLAQFYGE